MFDQSKSTSDDFKTKIDFGLCMEHLEFLFHDDDWIEFRSFQGRNAASHCYYSTLSRLRNDPAPVQAWLEDHNDEIWKGIYFGVNPRSSRNGSGLRNMGTDEDVKTFRAVFVDFDDANYSEAMEKLDRTSLPDPTLAVSSGRLSGTHLYWIFENEIEDEVIWKGLQRALISMLNSDPSIHNPSRIMRLSGTFNYSRNNDCRIIYRGEKLERWEDLGIEPAKVFEREYFTAPSDIKPTHENLNITTLQYLNSPCPEGERNLTLFAAAMDYNGNGFPIQDALRELADERAIARDGLPRGEAYRTVSNAYRRPATPTHYPRIIEGDDDDRFTMLAMFLSIDRGIDPGPSWDEEKEKEWLANPTPVDVDFRADPKTRHVKEKPLQIAKVTEEEIPLDVQDIPPWQCEYGETENVRIENCTHKQQGTKKATIAHSARQIAAEMYESLGKWPKYCEGLGPFFLMGKRGTPRIHAPRNPSDLFAILHGYGEVNWASKASNVYSPTFRRASLLTKAEFFEYLVNTPIDDDHHYESISYYPQIPVNPNTFYVPLQLPKPTGKYLQILINSFNAASPVDRQLLLSALLTPGWGGPPGTRPIFIFTSEYGQGSGKTETAKLIGEVWGGAVALDASLPWDQLTRSIMSSPDYLSRVFLFDNLKGRFSAASIEAGVTAKRISGHKMYHGTVTRPNDATFFVTYNMPELSRDLAQRSIVIKLGRPSTANFVVWANEFLRKHRLELLADLMHILGGRSKPVSGESGTRWRAWQEGVLAKIPGADIDLVTQVIRDRQGISDGERSDGAEIAFAIRQYLVARKRWTGDFANVITAWEVYAALTEAGVWRGKDAWSDSKSRQMCARYARASLMGTKLLQSPEAGRDRVLVRVTHDGSPTTGGGPSRSTLFAFSIAEADEWLAEQGIEVDSIQGELSL